MNKPTQGYVRADVPLNVLDTSVHKSSTSPLAGLLEISTEDEQARLAVLDAVDGRLAAEQAKRS